MRMSGPSFYAVYMGKCTTNCLLNVNFPYIYETSITESGFGGLGVSVLAFGTRVRGFKPGRSRRIFRAKKSPARLPSEGK